MDVTAIGGPGERRNERYADWWSLTHVAWAVVLTLVIGPFWALVAMVLWEPFEVLLLSPLLGRRGIIFGHESLRNSLMDIVFDVVGVFAGMWLVLPFWDPFSVL